MPTTPPDGRFLRVREPEGGPSVTATGRDAGCGLPEESQLACRNDRGLRKSLHALWPPNPGSDGPERTAPQNFAHGYFQYPAMMVPGLVGCLLDQVAEHRRGPMRLLDPFAGSGTVVTEAIARGWDVTAIDVNPLAALLCRTKAGPFLPKATATAVDGVLARVRQAEPGANHRFPNVGKWFEPEVIEGLSRLRRAIGAVGLPAARRFLWVAMAETVRLTSNSRLSTVKLHVKVPGDRAPMDPTVVFARIAARNLDLLGAQASALRKVGRLRRGWPPSRATVVLGDAACADLSAIRERPNVLVTSPPYGDNHSTVTYGQHAYLPLQWIDPSDTGADPSTLRGPTAIDSMSLGGRRQNGLGRAESLCAKSEAARVTLSRLVAIRQDHADKVGAFLGDLELALDRVLGVLDAGSHIVVLVGDRTVSGARVPTARIVQDIVGARGAVAIAAIPRQLPTARRMATRNRFASRMDTEWALAMRLP